MYFHSFKALIKQYPGYIIAGHKYFQFMEPEAVPLKITVPDDDKYIVAKDPRIAEVIYISYILAGCVISHSN